MACLSLIFVDGNRRVNTGGHLARAWVSQEGATIQLTWGAFF
jgi:hypothetical protein